MKPRTEEFRELSSRALENTFLRQAIATANRSFQASREVAIDSIPEWEALRTAGSAAKAHAVDRLPHALEAFEERFTADGGHVHYAEDGAAASEIIAAIARRVNARRVVKSKSMVTEEIQLNARLEADGLDVVETDFGEYIVQLAGETPSHIITPAIHKSRGEIARLLHEKIGSPADADIPTMTRAARAALRSCFLDAEVGVTGANFLVAETGTIVIVENEGNARMVTTLPRVHVAVVGIEKVVARRSDLAGLLRLLTRSATGQKITSYVNFIGARRGASETDGPDEIHVVLLDNGRSRMFRDPKMRETLRCIRCGACLNFCPVYERIGGHAYGWVYPGPIGSVLTPQLLGLDRAKLLPQASSLCGRCGEVCPVKIPLPELLLENRALAVEAGSSRLLERLGMRAFARLVRSPRLWRVSLGLARPAYRLACALGIAKRLPGSLRAWSRARELPRARVPSFRSRWRREDGWRREGASSQPGGDARGGIAPREESDA